LIDRCNTILIIYMFIVKEIESSLNESFVERWSSQINSHNSMSIPNVDLEGIKYKYLLILTCRWIKDSIIRNIWERENMQVTS
jgi:hypothetical protein